MIARTCALPAFLLAVGSTAAAQLQLVQQTRSISGLAHAQSSGGTQQGSFDVSAPDSALFQASESAHVQVTYAGADAIASQTSEIAGERITGEGQAIAFAAAYPAGAAYAGSDSRLIVTFQVTDTLVYSLTGSLGRSGNAYSPTVQLEQGGVPIHSVELPSGSDQTSFQFQGLLAPGTYALSAVASTNAWELQSDTIDQGTGSFQLEFTVEPTTGLPYCTGDGTGTACPCANDSAPSARVGCLNSQGTGGKLRAQGAASLSNDTLVLFGSQMPNSSALYFQGTFRQNGGNGASFGDGKRCAGGTLTRLGEKNNLMGASHYPSAGNVPISIQGSVTSPGTRTYQVWYRNAADFCTAATYNMTNGVEVLWGT